MSVFDFLIMALPVVFLILSVLIAVKAVSHGRSRKRTMLMQLASFAAVFAICMICPFAASAATGDAAAASGSDGMAFIVLLLRLSAQQARIPKRSVRQSSSLLSVKVSRSTVCLFQL